MRSWNVIVTVMPGPGRQSRLLERLRRLGHFERTEFKNVCSGYVEDTAHFLEELQAAHKNNESWIADLGHVIPVEQTFSFTPETLISQLKQAVVPLVPSMTEGSFHVRLERRGLHDQVMSQEVEREVGEHLQALAEAAGKRVQVSFANADYIVAVETIGTQCGITLLDRTFRERFPFVLPH